MFPISIAPVTLDAEILGGALLQMIAEIGAHWIMTGQAVHGLAGAVIDNLFSNGMAEGALGFMAPGADGIAIRLQHGKPV